MSKYIHRKYTKGTQIKIHYTKICGDYTKTISKRNMAFHFYFRK